jgi:Na+-transporting NADH:ubiquinone oxidoreductase subunit NqrD
MTVGGRWRKEGSALAAPAAVRVLGVCSSKAVAVAVAVAVTFSVCLLGKAASDKRWR